MQLGLFDILDERQELFVLISAAIGSLIYLTVEGTIPSSTISTTSLLYVWLIALGAVYFFFAKSIHKGVSAIWYLALIAGTWFAVNQMQTWLYIPLFIGLIALALVAKNT